MLRFVADEMHDGHDSLLLANSARRQVDYLFFLDSRGISRGFAGSIADRATQFVARQGSTFILVNRPVELTTWATLVNFLTINEISARVLVTNMGFVDFTPKKKATLERAVEQVRSMAGSDQATISFLEKYPATDGMLLDLYRIDYGDRYRQVIDSFSRRQHTIILNSPDIDPAIHFERRRPLSFFSALTEANQFNRQIAGAEVIDFEPFDESLTYDAVHYTDRGNELIFSRLKESM